MRPILTPLVVALGVFAAAGACSNNSAQCTPGQQVSCACPGGGTGAQTCNADGTGFNACVGCTTPIDSGADAPSSGDGGGASDYVYVLATITSSASSASTVEGFNIDGLYSTTSDANGCNQGDKLSALDPDQNQGGCAPTASGCVGGVDNEIIVLYDLLQSAGAADDERTKLTNMVSGGRYALLVRVTGVTSFTDDATVNVSLMIGYPTFSSSCAPVVGGRSYVVAASSLSGSTIDTATLTATGSITGGRLEVAFPKPATLGFPLSGSLVPVMNTILRADITATDLTNGNFGGAMTSSSVKGALDSAFPSYAAVINNSVNSMIDLQVSNTCTNGDLSMGFAFTGVTAVIPPTNNVASAPASGTCGASDGG